MSHGKRPTQQELDDAANLVIVEDSIVRQKPPPVGQGDWTGGWPVVVRFTDETEWLADLTASKADVVKNTVRITAMWRADGQMPIAALYVIACYRNGAELVELRKYMGDVMSGEKDTAVHQRADVLLARLRDLVRAHGFDVRGGYYWSPWK